jgi:signal transduction histidine kinase
MAIRRAAGFTLTSVAMAFYVVIVYAVMAGGFTLLGGRSGRPLPALLATVLVSLSYPRVRRRVGSIFESRLGPKRISPEEATTELLQSWGGDLPARELLSSVARLIGQATSASSVDVRPNVPLWSSATWTSAEKTSASPDFEHLLPIVFEGDILGEISILTTTAEGPSPKERELIGGLSDQIALSIRNASLAHDIESQLEEIASKTKEIRATRRRTVEAQDSERRVLERNIHDGVQQYLVAMAVRLSLARRSKDANKTVESLKGAARLAREALDRLEELTSGVSSQVLLEEGLEHALAKAAEASPLQVEVVAEGVGRLPEEAEVAVYFSCLEALQNAIKHSGASKVTITLVLGPGELRFTVSDDGKGFDPDKVQRGVGLRNLSDRLSGLEGAFEISTGRRVGTTIIGKVPIAQRAIR